MSISDRIEYAKMKARHQKKLLPWYKKWWGVLIVVALFLLFIVVFLAAFYVFDEVKKIQEEEARSSIITAVEDKLKLIEGNNDNYYIGAPKTGLDSEPLVITNFSNFSCVYSAKISKTIREIAEEFKTDIRFVYRDYPSPDSIVLSLGARCAGEQGKFWEMHDLIFELQEDLAIVIDEAEKKYALEQMADILELDVERFNKCVEDKKYLNQIRKDYEDGEKLKIKGTPTWFINGMEITGGLSKENLTTLILGLKNIK
ncbi:thioredoxin domain-containing protein [Patescibacteria group bacterium]|nr:thioredoxin domain-containing protein [Patescibacteria group bacterium]